MKYRWFLRCVIITLDVGDVINAMVKSEVLSTLDEKMDQRTDEWTYRVIYWLIHSPINSFLNDDRNRTFTVNSQRLLWNQA